jgi:hypothetical protein
MADKADIKAAILEAAGNPTSGLIADLADDFTEAVYRLYNPVVALSTEKETRVTKPTETR